MNPLTRLANISFTVVLFSLLFYFLVGRKMSKRETPEMASLLRLTTITIVTLTFAFWLNGIIRKFDPILLIETYFIFMSLVLWIAFPLLIQKNIFVKILAGAVTGYLIMVISYPLVEMSVYGKEAFRLSIFYWPIMSLGWLHAAVVIFIICWKRNE